MQALNIDILSTVLTKYILSGMYETTPEPFWTSNHKI